MLATIGRVVFGLAFCIFGINHFINGGQMGGMVPGWLPGGVFWVYLTGAAMLAAGICIVINKKVFLAGILLAVVLMCFVLMIHLPQLLDGNQMAMSSLLKDTALAAAALYLAGTLRT